MDPASMEEFHTFPATIMAVDAWGPRKWIASNKVMFIHCAFSMEGWCQRLIFQSKESTPEQLFSLHVLLLIGSGSSGSDDKDGGNRNNNNNNNDNNDNNNNNNNYYTPEV